MISGIVKPNVMTKKGHRLNWNRSLNKFYPKYYRGEDFENTIPQTIDLRSKDTPIFDQADSDCVANMGCGILDFLEKKYGIRPDNPGNPEEYSQTQLTVASRRFAYYNCRKIDNTLPQDQGTYLHTFAEFATQIGACQEANDPYNASDLNTVPSEAAYEEASNHKVRWALPIEDGDIGSIDSSLAAGFPCGVGILVFNQIENVGPDGIIDYPSLYDTPIGGHAVVIVGRIMVNGVLYYIVRNSWGTLWGIKGYGLIPAQYLANTNLSSDFWTFR